MWIKTITESVSGITGSLHKVQYNKLLQNSICKAQKKRYKTCGRTAFSSQAKN